MIISSEDVTNGAESLDVIEYRTASELFDLMANRELLRNNSLDEVNETSTNEDLVILYKKIDLDTKLMSNTEELQVRKPNRRVETIVYEDPDSDGSNESEVYTSEEIQDLLMINKETIDLFNQPSFGSINTLCQKLGELDIQASNLSLQYNRRFPFKDPYVQDRLMTLSNKDGFPPSLLDYICCKRLEDNYNFYMDSIIIYVKNTIEQLKRISNGDYLTDKAKERWREEDNIREDNSKVLATSTSIPLQVECKDNGHLTTWDDIIHSEVDIRSLSKILEKKIIIEVPKMICGSYKLFSKLCSENLVISCKKPKQVPTQEKESRVDVILQLGRSKTGHVVSNIRSVMFLQPIPPVFSVECPKLLPISCDQEENKNAKIIEIPDNEDSPYEYNEVSDEKKYEIPIVVTPSKEDINFSKELRDETLVESKASSSALMDSSDDQYDSVVQKETPYNFLSLEDLSLSIHKFNMSSLPEEINEDAVLDSTNKCKSQTKIRIKSPYENKSHVMEEKKRKRLLEIREKREKRKLAVGANCKIAKHRYGKDFNTPQPTNSVTKFSITNKSFYNSIYGHNLNVENRLSKSTGRKNKRELPLETIPLVQLEDELESPAPTPKENSRKYINRSYYLDEPVTAITATESKPNDNAFAATSSAMSSDFSANMDIISQIINLPESGVTKKATNTHDNASSFNKIEDFDELPEKEQGLTEIKVSISLKSINAAVPANSPKDEDYNIANSKKVSSSLGCRKSIDKLYGLMKTIKKIESVDQKSSCNESKMDSQCRTTVGSDSGTSFKHHQISSNPSTLSFEKIHNPDDCITNNNTAVLKTGTLPTVVPKVIISTKQQDVPSIVDRSRKDRKKVALNSLPKVPDNPLKAISQLLHEFDSVQNTRRKAMDTKINTKPGVVLDSRNIPRHGTWNRRTRPERLGKERESRVSEIVESKLVKVMPHTDKKLKQNLVEEQLKTPQQQIIPGGGNTVHTKKKRISDMLDEVKEAKGEAVRGPKLVSRLDTLAQPKKSYVQAHGGENHTKYGRNLMTNRLQKLAPTPHPAVAMLKSRSRPVSVRPSMQPLERAPNLRPVSGSPKGKVPPDASCKQRQQADVPDPLKRKMVAVESYVKSHYGRSSPTAPSILKARIPLVPNDLDLSFSSSPNGEESSVIGSKLHHMINNIVNFKPPPLGLLSETQETNYRASRDGEHTPAPTMQDCNCDPGSSNISEYPLDIFEDKNVKTAVESFESQHKEPLTRVNSNKSLMKYEGDLCNSSAKNQQLEVKSSACMSMMTIRNCLKINQLILSPKPSLRQVLVLESGDAGSIVLESAGLKMQNSRSNEDINVRSVAKLAGARFDWNFTNIPMQVTTVGYAFPEYSPAFSGSSSAVKSLNDIFNLKMTAMKDDKQSNKENFNSLPQSKVEPVVQEITKKNTEDASSVPLIKQVELTSASVGTDSYISYNDQGTCGNCTELSNVAKLPAVEANLKLSNQNSVDCASSLDLLVGILNEIQKITTSHITNAEIFADENDHKCNETVEGMKSNDSLKLVSITSLDKLRQLESSPSIYSFYLSNDDKDSITNMPISIVNIDESKLCDGKPTCIDKEVSADLHLKELTHTFTDVPSIIFPVMVTHSTNITNSLLGVLSKPSSQSVVSVQDFDSLDSIFTHENSKKIGKYTRVQQQPMIEYYSSQSEELVVVNKTLNEERRLVTINNLFSDHVQTKYCMKSPDFDPMIKMKRDILVTMYSMLVLTVFAALTFPEILYHV